MSTGKTSQYQAGKHKITEEILRLLAIPRNHWKASLAEIPDRFEYRNKILQWCNESRSRVESQSGLLLHGPCSSGKSAVASICLQAAFTHGVFGFWVSALGLTEYQIKEIPFNDEETIWERAQRTPLLVLDEVQVVKGNSSLNWNMYLIERLIRSRVDDGKCTIFTMNYSQDDLMEKHPSLFAVLHEAVTPVCIQGYDFRQLCYVKPKAAKGSKND